MKPLALQLLSCSLLCTIGAVTYGQASSSVWTKSIGIQYATPESNPPSVFIEYPTNNQRVGESILQTVISAADDTRVEAFQFSLNGAQSDWSWAPGMQYPWGTSIQLNPGLNTFEVLCADYWGNVSSASVTFEYVPASAPATGLMLDIGNGGQVTPNYQGQTLTMGQRYSMIAHPAKGFRFDGWSGSLPHKRPKLTFIMEPNLALTARFKDIKRPLDIITFRRTKSTLTATNLIATGKATDNSSVTNVYYQLNDSGWETAITTNAWRNWETDALSPIPGRNVLKSYAVDDSGLCSRTNRVRFRY